MSFPQYPQHNNNIINNKRKRMIKMKLVVKKEILLESLNNTARAISTKNLIPILTGIKFDLKDDGLYLYASDTDVSIRSFIPKNKLTSLEETGSIVIGGKYIVEIIRKLPNTDISIEVIDGYKMIVSTDNTEFNLNGINPNEFPNLDLDETKEPIVINNGIFKDIINQTVFAISQSETRPLLTGINFRINNGELDVIATDSYRLARKLVAIDKVDESDINIVIPGKNLVELTKMLDNDEDSLELHLFSNKVLFKQNNLLFQSRLVSGNYPNVNNLIPSDSFLKITANLSNLYDVIDRASILTSDKEKNIVTLETNKNLLIVRSSSAEIGRVEEKMNITKDNEEEIKISFSAKYMMDALRSFEGDTVELAFEGEVKPIIIKDVEDPNLTQLVLPIRTY